MTRVLAENLIGLAFLYCVSYIKPTPTHEKKICCGKKWPKCHFSSNFFFGWFGLGLGSSSVSVLYLYIFPTQQSLVNRKHPITGVRSNQDLIWCVKIAVYMGFNVYGGSWLLWLPVKNSVFAENVVGFRFLVVCSLYRNQSRTVHWKNCLPWGKDVAQMPLST